MLFSEFFYDVASGRCILRRCGICLDSDVTFNAGDRIVTKTLCFVLCFFDFISIFCFLS